MEVSVFSTARKNFFEKHQVGNVLVSLIVQETFVLFVHENLKVGRTVYIFYFNRKGIILMGKGGEVNKDKMGH